LSFAVVDDHFVGGEVHCAKKEGDLEVLGDGG
jgi:hypothetical protein